MRKYLSFNMTKEITVCLKVYYSSTKRGNILFNIKHYMFFFSQIMFYSVITLNLRYMYVLFILFLSITHAVIKFESKFLWSMKFMPVAYLSTCSTAVMSDHPPDKIISLVGHNGKHFQHKNRVVKLWKHILHTSRVFLMAWS